MSAKIGEYLVEGLVFPENQYKFAVALAMKFAEDYCRDIIILQRDVFDGDFTTRVVETVRYCD
jgi:hypothetical protein